MDYNTLMQKVGKRINPTIYYFVEENKITLENDDIISVKPHFEAKLIGTVMRGLDIELRKELPSVPVYFENTVTYSGETSVKTIGPYYLKETPTYNADNKTYSHILYDEFINSMVDYVPIQMTYPTTVINYFQKLCEECGYTTNITELPNGNRIMATDIYKDIGFTYRDVYEDIGQATATLFGMNGKEVVKCSLGTNEVTLNDDILKNQNIEAIGHFGPINAIILSRSADSDKIGKRDETLKEWNEFKISDNQLMNDNNRSDYLDELYEALYGIEYDAFDFELIGYGGFDILQKVRIETGNNVYNSYIFNNEEEYTQGYSESIYTEIPEENEPDYKISDMTDKRLKQTYLIVDKQNQTITSLASDVEQYDSRIAEVEQTVDSIEQKVENTIDFKRTVVGRSFIHLENATAGPLLKLSISNMRYTYLSNKTFPSSELYPKNNIFILDKTRELSDEAKIYYMPYRNLYYFDDNTYDELIIERVINEDGTEKHTVSIIHRCKLTENLEVIPLIQPVIETFEDIDIQLFEGDNYFYMNSFQKDAVRYEATYVIKSEFEDIFATKVELNSSIKQTKEEINLSVEEDINDSEERLRGEIKTTKDEIDLEVSKKVGNDEIISKINQTAEDIQISAKRISLEGLITANQNFKVLNDGSIEAKNGSFTGNIYLQDGNKVVGGDGLYTNLQYNSAGPYQSWDLIGFMPRLVGQSVTFDYQDLVLVCSIPKNFKIEHAYITLLTTPINTASSDLSNGNSSDVVGKPKSLRLYKSNSLTTAPLYWFFGSDYYYGNNSTSLTEISSAFGTRNYTPGNSSAGYVDSKVSIDLKSHLVAGQTNILVVRTAVTKPGNSTNTSGAANNTGAGKMILDIYGFMSTV